MSSQAKANVDEGVERDVKVVERPYHLLLRFLALSLTLVATIIVALDNQTKLITYAQMQFKATAKWEYVSAIVYFLVTNAIACSYAAASLIMTVMVGRKNDMAVLGLTLTGLDLVMVALLFSANGAACAVGVIAQKGNSHTQWMKVCNVFDSYCRHVTAALVLSIIASTLFLLLVLLSLLKLHYRTRN